MFLAIIITIIVCASLCYFPVVKSEYEPIQQKPVKLGPLVTGAGGVLILQEWRKGGILPIYETS